MAYWIGGVVTLLLVCSIAYAYKLGKQDGERQAMERVYEAQQARNTTKPVDIYALLDADLRKRIEAL